MQHDQMGNDMRMLLLALLLTATTAGAAPLTITYVAPDPSLIDTELSGRVWEMLKRETGAPAYIYPPRIVIEWDVPANARMVTTYPTAEQPDGELLIAISPATLIENNRLRVAWALGHEMVHYLWILRENDWQYRAVYRVRVRHHCNSQFQQQTDRVADFIWSIYHNSDDQSWAQDEAKRACTSHPEQ